MGQARTSRKLRMPGVGRKPETQLSRMTEQNRRILIIPAGNPGNMLLLEETDIYRDGRPPCVPC
jgi:hypothetical protein